MLENKVMIWLAAIYFFEVSGMPHIFTNQNALEDDALDIPLGTPDMDLEIPGEPLTPQEFVESANIELLSPALDQGSFDPILSAGLFEGDIVGFNASDVVQDRNAIRNLNLRWPRGIVPYVISASFNRQERLIIAAALREYHELTCIKFIPRTFQRSHVHFVKGVGCSSSIGRSDLGGQHVNLGHGCVMKGIVQHELMHALGFWHEQSRADRDNYVSVYYENIIPGMENNFHKYSWSQIQSLDMPYDASSLMHYGRYAFSKDIYSPTIVPKNPKVQIGQRSRLSPIDIAKINILYECDATNIGRPAPQPKPIIKCSDNNKYCTYWARIGECQKNPRWMNVHCAKACQRCDRSCDNYNELCGRWAEVGECYKRPDYMNIYCPRACNVC